MSNMRAERVGEQMKKKLWISLIIKLKIQE